MNCFDAQFTMRIAAFLALVAAIAIALVQSTAAFVLLLITAVLGFYVIAELDRRRVSCVTLSLTLDEAATLLHLPDMILGDVLHSGGSVARLARSLRLIDPIPVPAGVRSIPLALIGPGTRALWIEPGTCVPLDGQEIPGALTVVAGGEELAVEVVFGGRPGTPAKVLAVMFTSSAGAVQSWGSIFPGVAEDVMLPTPA